VNAAGCFWSQCARDAVASVGYTYDLTLPPVLPWRPYCQEHLERVTVDPDHRRGMLEGAAEHGEQPLFVVIDQRVPQATADDGTEVTR
jgi:hypothetical protein